MPITIKADLDAAGFCLCLKQEIKKMGTAKAFGIGNLVIAYSGPSDLVKGALSTSFTSNWQRSQKQAKRLRGRRIDDTQIGKFLSSFDFDSYFTGFYGLNVAAKESATFEVWMAASKEFMGAKFRELATAVCAADPARVFRSSEMAAVLQNPRVKKINNRPADLFREFLKLHPEEAYRLFCITELLEARRHAAAVSTKEAWDDYRERRLFFVVEQRMAIATISSPSKEMYRVEKNLILRTVKVAAITSSLTGGALRPSVRTAKLKTALSPK